MIGRVAASDVPVMITGRVGQGRAGRTGLHNYSAPERQEFLAINCAAIPENLLEVSSSVTRKALSPERIVSELGVSSRAITAPSFLMRSEKCPYRYTARFFACCKR